jgi:opacity protein-like surface antigen
VIKRSAFVLMAALVLGAAPATAQTIQSPYDFVDRSMSLWAFGSAVFTDRGPLEIGPGSGYAAGIGYSVRVSGPFNFDARAAFLPTSRRVFEVVPTADTAAVRENPMVGLNQIGTADLSLLLVDASLRFDITGPRTWNKLQPYALIGAGAALGVSSDDAIDEELPEDSDLEVDFKNGFTGHVGAGVEWYASDRFSVRLDARDILWKINVPDGFFTDTRIVDADQWVQTAHVSLGLAFRF